MLSLLRAMLGLALLQLVPTAMAGSPIEVQVELPQSVIPIGQPLEMTLRIRNTSDQAINQLGLFTGEFYRTYYLGVEEIGCQVVIYSINPAPGHPFPPPLFGFTWHVHSLGPGDSVSCQLRFPYTFIPGTDTIPVYSFVGASTQLATTFNYTLIPSRAPAQPVPTGHPMLWLVLAALFGVAARRCLR